MTSIDIGNPTVLANFISGVLGGLTVAIANHLNTRNRERERAEDSRSAKFSEMRVSPYTTLMKSLESISSDRMKAATLEHQQNIARATAEIMHQAIYSDIGLLASTGTREVILCTRSRCARFAAGECSYAEMMDAIWAIHQMLRADLNHHQDRVEREIDRVRASRKRMAVKQDVIEKIIRQMPHVRWPRVGETPAGVKSGWWSRLGSRK